MSNGFEMAKIMLHGAVVILISRYNQLDEPEQDRSCPSTYLGTLSQICDPQSKAATTSHALNTFSDRK